MNIDEATSVDVNGRKVTLRPIRRTDKLLETDFISHLSDESRRYRFFGSVQQLSDEELDHLCNVDHHQAEAFIALVEEDGGTREVGVVRYCESPNSSAHEMALTIADDFHETSLGRLLVERLVAHARQHGVSSLYSIELRGNRDMHRLADQMGMSASHDPDDLRLIRYTLSIDD